MHRETDVSNVIFEATGGLVEVVEKATDFQKARIELLVIIGSLQSVQTGVAQALKRLAEIEQGIARLDDKARAGKTHGKPTNSDESTCSDTAHAG